MNGKGSLFYKDKKLAYDGDWENDKFQGFVIFFIILLLIILKLSFKFLNKTFKDMVYQ